MSLLFKTVLPSLNMKTEHIYDDNNAEAISDYNPFIINKAFMQGNDTLMYAVMMNIHPNIPDRWVYDFYWYGLDKRKRFNKWVKPEKDENVESVMKYFKCSSKKAKEYLKILDENEIIKIKECEDYV